MIVMNQLRQKWMKELKIEQLVLLKWTQAPLGFFLNLNNKRAHTLIAIDFKQKEIIDGKPT